MDNNAFGINDKLMLGGVYMTDGWIGAAMYEHSADREYGPGWDLTGMYTREKRADTDQKGKEIRRFSADTIYASAGMSHLLTDEIKTLLHFSWGETKLRSHDDPLAAPAEGMRIIGINPGISAEESDWDGYLLSRRIAALNYTYNWGIDSPSAHVVTFEGAYEKSLIPGLRLNFQTGLRYAYDRDKNAFFEDSPDSAKVAILPRSFSARNYAGVSLGIEQYLYKFEFGTLSALASYQAVYSDGAILGKEYDQGIAGALRFYLSKLAFPALEIGGAYNLPAHEFLFTFSLGLSF
jgi:hypothetical protein